MVAYLRSTRGVRNCNPLNIRIGSQWLGLCPQQTDAEFCQFRSMLYGLRAAMMIIRRYIQVYHLCSVDAIIHRWAPPADGNATREYVRAVARSMQVEPDDVIIYDAAYVIPMVQAMAIVESRYMVSDDLAWSAYLMTV